MGACHEFGDLLDTPLGAWLLLVWLFMLGSFFGSFANVVIYRLPLGQSLLWPGSHCPTCNHPIRWHDNVPVFGWLMLNGRCRDCRAPISVRYPLVEALFGFLLATLGWLEVADAHDLARTRPFAALSACGDCRMAVLVGYHISAVGHAGRGGFDRSRPAAHSAYGCWFLHWRCGRCVAAGLECAATGAAAPRAAGSLRNQPPLRAARRGDWPESAAGALAGLPGLAGDCSGSRAAAGRAPWCWSWPRSARFLGWQAVCGIAVIAAIGDLLIALVSLAWPARGRRIGWPAWLAIGTGRVAGLLVDDPANDSGLPRESTSIAGCRRRSGCDCVDRRLASSPLGVRAGGEMTPAATSSGANRSSTSPANRCWPVCRHWD